MWSFSMPAFWLRISARRKVDIRRDAASLGPGEDACRFRYLPCRVRRMGGSINQDEVPPSFNSKERETPVPAPPSTHRARARQFHRRAPIPTIDLKARQHQEILRALFSFLASTLSNSSSPLRRIPAGVEYGDDRDGLGICEVQDRVREPAHESPAHFAVHPLKLLGVATDDLDRCLNAGHELLPKAARALSYQPCASSNSASPAAAPRSTGRRRARPRFGPRGPVRRVRARRGSCGRRRVPCGDCSRAPQGPPSPEFDPTAPLATCSPRCRRRGSSLARDRWRGRFRRPTAPPQRYGRLRRPRRRLGAVGRSRVANAATRGRRASASFPPMRAGRRRPPGGSAAPAQPPSTSRAEGPDVGHAGGGAGGGWGGGVTTERPAWYLYVIELSAEVWEVPRFRARNRRAATRHEEGEPVRAVYIGVGVQRAGCRFELYRAIATAPADSCMTRGVCLPA